MIPPSQPPVCGRIVLVGGGPGDPDLLTIAGHRALSQADVIVYDRLVNREILAAARSDARLIYAGKRPGPMTQEEINSLLCLEARRGHLVVRLKGGDPFVFGRGGEEALAAIEAGIPFSVVPGITAATAVPAYAGIPVTHRGLASAVTVLTGHEDPSKGAESVDWTALARLGGTIILLMGVDTLRSVCTRLIEAGLSSHTPAAVIQAGTTPDQRVVRGPLHNIAEIAEAEGIQPPATTIIGGVAALADKLHWWVPTRG